MENTHVLRQAESGPSGSTFILVWPMTLESGTTLPCRSCKSGSWERNREEGAKQLPEHKAFKGVSVFGDPLAGHHASTIEPEGLQ